MSTILISKQMAQGPTKSKTLLCEYSTEKVGFSTSGNIRSHFGALEIGGVRVEIMGDVQKLLPDGSWEDPIDPAEHRLSVETEGIQVPVLNLAYECSAYEALGALADCVSKPGDHWVSRACACLSKTASRVPLYLAQRNASMWLLEASYHQAPERLRRT